jgi:hypothetical protein
MLGMSIDAAKIAALALGLLCGGCNRPGFPSGSGAVARIVITPPSASIAISGTVTFTAALFDDDDNLLTDRSVEWRSSTPSVVNITQGGVATGIGAGVAVISAIAEGRSNSASVSVVTGVALSTTQAVANVTGIVNTPISPVVPVTASGGAPPYTFALSGGALPTGLTFNTATGALGGTPVISQTATTYTVTATDALNATSSQTFTLTVNDAVVAGIKINVSAAATATVNGTQQLAIPLELDLTDRGANDLASLTVTIQWDPARFSFTSESAGSWPGGSVIVGTPTASQIVISGFSVTGATTSFTLRNIVLTAAATGAPVTTAVTATVNSAGNQAGGQVTVTPRNLSVTINP